MSLQMLDAKPGSFSNRSSSDTSFQWEDGAIAVLVKYYVSSFMTVERISVPFVK